MRDAQAVREEVRERLRNAFRYVPAPPEWMVVRRRDSAYPEERDVVPRLAPGTDLFSVENIPYDFLFVTEIAEFQYLFAAYLNLLLDERGFGLPHPEIVLEFCTISPGFGSKIDKVSSLTEEQSRSTADVFRFASTWGGLYREQAQAALSSYWSRFPSYDPAAWAAYEWTFGIQKDDSAG